MKGAELPPPLAARESSGLRVRGTVFKSRISARHQFTETHGTTLAKAPRFVAPGMRVEPPTSWWQNWWQTETEKPDSVGLRGNLAGHSTPTPGTT